MTSVLSPNVETDLAYAELLLLFTPKEISRLEFYRRLVRGSAFTDKLS